MKKFTTRHRPFRPQGLTRLNGDDFQPYHGVGPCVDLMFPDRKYRTDAPRRPAHQNQMPAICRAFAERPRVDRQNLFARRHASPPFLPPRCRLQWRQCGRLFHWWRIGELSPQRPLQNLSLGFRASPAVAVQIIPQRLVDFDGERPRSLSSDLLRHARNIPADFSEERAVPGNQSDSPVFRLTVPSESLRILSRTEASAAQAVKQ